MVTVTDPNWSDNAGGGQFAVGTSLEAGAGALSQGQRLKENCCTSVAQTWCGARAPWAVFSGAGFVRSHLWGLACSALQERGRQDGDM